MRFNVPWAAAVDARLAELSRLTRLCAELKALAKATQHQGEMSPRQYHALVNQLIAKALEL